MDKACFLKSEVEESKYFLGKGRLTGNVFKGLSAEFLKKIKSWKTIEAAHKAHESLPTHTVTWGSDTFEKLYPVAPRRILNGNKERWGLVNGDNELMTSFGFDQLQGER